MVNFKHKSISPNICYLYDIIEILCLCLLVYVQLLRMYCFIIFFAWHITNLLLMEMPVNIQGMEYLFW